MIRNEKCDTGAGSSPRAFQYSHATNRYTNVPYSIQYCIRSCSEKESVVVVLFSLLTHSPIRNWEQRTELYGVNDTKHSFYTAAGTLLTLVQAIY